MRFFLLDPLRGLAALWVFTFHFPFSQNFQDAYPRLHTFLKLGGFGVPMFFVISGYCIAASARGAIRKEESTRSFLGRRLRRIYPPFWCSIVVIAAIPFLKEILRAIMTGSYVAPVAEDNVAYGFLDYNIYEWLRLTTLTQIFWPIEDVHSLDEKFTTINAVYWTLAIEVQFYCVVILALSWSRRGFYGILLLTTVVCLPASLWGLMRTSGLFAPYWLMFAMGNLLYFLIERGWSLGHENLKPSKVISTLGTLILVTGIVAFLIAGSRGYRPSWNLFAIFFTACLWFAHRYDEQLQHLFEHHFWKHFAAPLIALGAMSYSVYLLHARIQYLMIPVIRQIFTPDSIAHDISVILVTLVVCWPFYLFCEAPFIKSKVSKAEQETSSDQETTT